MLVFTSKDLIQSVSRYNDEYHCTIVKVEFVSGAIRVHIDERGDMSLGQSVNNHRPSHLCKGSFLLGIIQPPSFSSLGIYDEGNLREAVRAKDGNFAVSNPESQYTGQCISPLLPTHDE